MSINKSGELRKSKLETLEWIKQIPRHDYQGKLLKTIMYMKQFNGRAGIIV